MSMNNARMSGCHEVIMHKNNILTEGGASNVFFAIEETVFTPALSNNILPGITRELLIDEIKQFGIKVEEGDYSVDDLKNAQSVWLTSSTKGLAQVTNILDLDIQLNGDNRLFQKCEQIFFEKFFS